MRVKEESEKAGLKLNIQKTKIMASSPTTSRQTDGEKVETVAGFIFLGSKPLGMVTAATKLKDACSLGKKAMTNLDSVLRSRNITLLTKVHIVRAIGYPIVMNRWESWIIKAERQRTDAFELSCWRRLLRAPWTARSSNQSILKDINPEYSLERLTL